MDTLLVKHRLKGKVVCGECRLPVEAKELKNHFKSLHAGTALYTLAAAPLRTFIEAVEEIGHLENVRGVFQSESKYINDKCQRIYDNYVEPVDDGETQRENAGVVEDRDGEEDIDENRTEARDRGELVHDLLNEINDVNQSLEELMDIVKGHEASGTGAQAFIDEIGEVDSAYSLRSGQLNALFMNDRESKVLTEEQEHKDEMDGAVKVDLDSLNDLTEGIKKCNEASVEEDARESWGESGGKEFHETAFEVVTEKSCGENEGVEVMEVEHDGVADPKLQPVEQEEGMEDRCTTEKEELLKLELPVSGFFNLGSSCFMNSVIQALIRIPVVAGILSQGRDNFHDCNNKECIMCPLKGILDEIQRGVKVLSPIRMWYLLDEFDWKFVRTRNQDAHEYMLALLNEVLEPRIPSDDHLDTRRSLQRKFYGEMNQLISCCCCGKDSVTTLREPLMNIAVDVKDIRSVQQGVDNYFGGSGSNRLRSRCAECQKVGESKREYSMIEPPDVLIVTLKRFTYDVAHKEAIKNSETIYNEETLKIRKGDGHVVYELSSIVRHHGSTLDRGHYTALVRNRENQYVQYNDDKFSITKRKKCGEDYVLVYVRKPVRVIAKDEPVNAEPNAEIKAARSFEGKDLSSSNKGMTSSSKDSSSSSAESSDQSDELDETGMTEARRYMNSKNWDTITSELKEESGNSSEASNSSCSVSSTDSELLVSADETVMEDFRRGINGSEKCSTPVNKEKEVKTADSKCRTKERTKAQPEDQKLHEESRKEQGSDDDSLLNTNYMKVAEDPSQVFANRDRPFTSEEILELLHEIQDRKITNPILTKPPTYVCGSDVFIYKLQRLNDKDYLCDRVNGFMNCGMNRKNQPFRKVFYKMQDPSMPGSKQFVSFEKHCYFLTAQQGKPESYVVIHYLGDEKLHVPRPHGNDRRGKIFVKNTETAKNVVREALHSEKRPKKIYSANVRSTEERLGKEFEKYGDVMAARNTKQVRNIKAQEKGKGRLSQCEIFGIYLMALTDYGKMILDIRLMPIESYIIAEPAAIKLAKQLLIESKRNPALEQLVTYDTTFDMGDTYVSTLVMRNIYLQGAPIFPVAFNLHSRKHRKAHRAFWENMEEQLELSQYAEYIPYTFDREVAFTKELKKKVPGAQVVFCHNHILTDVKVWLKKHGTRADISGYIKQLRVLLDSKSAEEFEEKYEEYRALWSKPYVKYFDKYIKNDAKTSSKFMALKFSAFAESIPTNNLSESLNAMLKQHCEYKALPKDTLFLALHQLQLEILSNFKRSYGASGDYACRKEFANTCRKIELPEYAHITQEKFISVLKSVEADVKGLEVPEVLNTNQTLAEACVEKHLITYERNSKTFIVRSPADVSKRNMVYFEPFTNKLHCSCICTTTMCYHKVAVLSELGMTIPHKRKPEISLTKLRTNKRAAEGRGRAGKKFKTRRVEEPVVHAAPDSEAALGTRGNQKIPLHGQKAKTKNKISRRSEREMDEGPSWFHRDLINEQYEQDNVQFGANLGSPGFKEVRKKSKSRPRDSEAGRGRAGRAEEESDKKVTNEEILVDSGSEESPELDYSDLLPETYIYGGTIAKAITVIIDMAVMAGEICAPDPHVEEIARNRKYRELLDVAMKYEIYTYDVVLQQMWVDDGTHYVLGGILFKPQIIFIMDSTKSVSKKREPEFKVLLRIASACLSTAGQLIDPSRWQLCYSLDAPQQDNGYDCGLFCARNVFNIVNRKKFTEVPYSNNAQAGRRWMLDLVKSKGSSGSQRKNRNKLSTRETERAIKHLDAIDEHRAEIVRRNMNGILKKEIRSLNKDWTSCGAELCLKDRNHSRRQIRCIKCRKWFHENCEPIENKKEFNDYEFCTSCAARDEDDVSVDRLGSQ